MITDNVDWMDVEDHGASTGNGYAPHICSRGYKGREQREGYTIIVTEEENPKTGYVNFIQLGRGEYVAFNQPSYSADKDGEALTITGKTNAPRLSFSLVDPDGIATLPATFSITPEGEEEITGQDVNGQVFADDPGSSVEIAFEIEITVLKNTTIGSRQCTLVATGLEGVGQTNILQEGAENYIYLNETGQTTAIITFGAFVAHPENVTVLSNDDWNINTSIPYWMEIDDHGDRHMDGILTFHSTYSNTGRESLSADIPLQTYGGSTAVVSVVQNGKDAFLSIQRIEDIKGAVVWTPSLNQSLYAGEGLYFIIGTSNCKNIFVSEDDGYTNIEAVDEGVNYAGFDLIESNGVTHNNVPTEQDIEGDPGATAQYTVKIPFKLTENDGNEGRQVVIDIYDSDYDDDPTTGVHTQLGFKQDCFEI